MRAYVQEHFPELRKTCPHLTLERVLEGAVSLVKVAGEARGFVSLERVGDTLRVIALYLEKGVPAALLDKVLGRTIDHAKAEGCSRIEWDTTRKGWLRRLAHLNARVEYYRMVKEL